MVFAEMFDNVKFFIGGIYTLASSLTIGILLFIYIFIVHVPLAIWGGILSYNYFYKCNSRKIWLEFEKNMYDWFLKENYEIQRTIIYKLIAYIILYAILFIYKVLNFVLFMIVFVFTLFIPYVFLLFYFLFVYLQNQCSMEGLDDFEKATGIDIDNSGYKGDAGNLLANNQCIKDCSNVLKNTCQKSVKDKDKQCSTSCDNDYKEATKNDNKFISFFKPNKEAGDIKKKCNDNCNSQKKIENDSCNNAFEICTNKCTDPSDELEEAFISQDYKNEYTSDLENSAKRAWDTTEQNATNARIRAENAGSSTASGISNAENSQRTGFLAMLGS